MSISEINLSYSETDPDLLFAQIKVYCEISCATSKAKKFKLTIAHKIPMEVGEITIASQADDPFTKEELTDKTDDSHRRKLPQLLNFGMMGSLISLQSSLHVYYILKTELHINYFSTLP